MRDRWGREVKVKQVVGCGLLSVVLVSGLRFITLEHHVDRPDPSQIQRVYQELAPSFPVTDCPTWMSDCAPAIPTDLPRPPDAGAAPAGRP